MILLDVLNGLYGSGNAKLYLKGYKIINLKDR